MSFAGPVTFRNAHDLHAAARLVPAELIMVETDAPFLAPHPHRGRKNGPYALPYTLRAMAQLRETDIGELASAVMTTTRARLRPGLNAQVSAFLSVCFCRYCFFVSVLVTAISLAIPLPLRAVALVTVL